MDNCIKKIMVYLMGLASSHLYLPVEHCICAFFLGLFHHGGRCCARKEIREKTPL